MWSLAPRDDSIELPSNFNFCQLLMFLDFFLQYFAKVQCLDQPAVWRMVSRSTLASAAALVDDVLTLWGLKPLMSIPARPKMFLIKRDMVLLLKALYGLTYATNRLVIPIRRCLVRSKYSFTIKTTHRLASKG